MLSTGISHVALCHKLYEQISRDYVNEACHWVAGKWKQGESCNMMIVLFDMQDKMFRAMMVPGSLVVVFWFCADWFKLFVSEESLCLANRLFDVWRMKECGHPESWVK